MVVKLNKVVTNYWLDYYAANLCTLCGNIGIIDTRRARSAAGVLAGRRNYCICPNGQTLRYYKADPEIEAAIANAKR